MDFYQKNGAKLDKALTAVTKLLADPNSGIARNLIGKRHLSLSPVDRAFVLGLAAETLILDDAYNIDNPRHVASALDLAFGMAYHATDAWRSRGALDGK